MVFSRISFDSSFFFTVFMINFVSSFLPFGTVTDDFFLFALSFFGIIFREVGFFWTLDSFLMDVNLGWEFDIFNIGFEVRS